ncbi:extracellular solute-binding protein [Paenibacillus sp. IB182496]|uniref:Extracellular solute-binding protein n=1 Tax=Paenibacillus sabuli TaxID=2772509 RepID=A0A927BWC8_9BACL|nr:extracellular solute-binding protein [Paenibacillus sabuli]MBD2848083.1 extracellular solute-binding protein [Paenibacillus sabuli]
MRRGTKTDRRMWTAIVIAMLLLAVVLAGCSDGNQEAGREASTADTANTDDGTAGNETNTANAEEEPPRRGSITSSIYDRGLVPKEEGTITDNRWTKWINENGPTDVKFEAIPRWDSKTKFNVMFASKSAPDVIFEYDKAYRDQLVTQKQIQPIDELIEQYSTTYKSLLDKYPEIRKITTREDGKMYEFAHVTPTGPNHRLYIRVDWLEQLGLETPKTSDELLETALAFANQDPDGNGADDTYGINLSFIGGMVVDYMFGDVFTIYEKIPWHVEDGRLVHAWERTHQAFSYMKELYDGGAVDKGFLADSQGEKAKQDWLNGKLGIYGGSGMSTSDIEAFYQNNPDSDFTVIPLPEGPNGAFSPAIGNPVQMTAVINSAAKDPEAAMRFIDFMADPDTIQTLQYGVEGETYQLVDGCPQIIDQERWQQEVSYTGDFRMLANRDPEAKKCPLIEPTPEQVKNRELQDLAQQYYVSEERPVPYLMMPELMPALPSDMQLVVTNAFKTILDNFQKSVVSGSSYTPDQAMEESMAAWERAGGAKIDAWYETWYNENKDTAFLVKDLYKFAPPAP